jgi:putative Mg2+ transporter-C (MgtC) family protein
VSTAEQIFETLRAEFSDVPDVAQITRLIVRLVLAAVLGGIRTHMLVAIGSALFVLVPQQGGMSIADMSRVIQGIVTGVGFLGAGAIIKHASEQNVQGLTTAAGVWMTSAIGIACGLGREVTAIVSTLLALAILSLIPRLFDKSGS